MIVTVLADVVEFSEFMNQTLYFSVFFVDVWVQDYLRNYKHSLGKSLIYILKASLEVI